MIVKPIKTRLLNPPRDNLFEAIAKSLLSLSEKSIVVITSKAVSIGEGQCIPASYYQNKDELTIREADFYLPRRFTPGRWCMHTIKNNLFIPSAGVDESNANGYYIVWPKNPAQSAKKLWHSFRKYYQVREVGIIISDSHTVPLRRGVLGVSLSHYGFVPLKDYRGTLDLFGRTLKMTQKNIADGLAAAAVLVMGEGDERTPVSVIRDVPWIEFTSRIKKSKRPFSSFEVAPQEDLYTPLLSRVPWKKGANTNHGTKLAR